jgi:hypothetical protein
MTIPSDHCYVSDPYNRISAEGQLKAAASGKYGVSHQVGRVPDCEALTLGCVARCHPDHGAC